MSWWEEFKENASEFWATGNWGKEEEQDPVSVPMQSKEERVQAAMQGDIELQRANQDLASAQQSYAKAKEALAAAEREASSKRTEAYVAEFTQAESAMKTAKAAYDDAARNEKSEKDKANTNALYQKWKAACARYDAVSTRSLWDEKHPLSNYVPKHLKEDEARTHRTYNEMLKRKQQVEAAARARAEATVGAQGR